MTPPTSTGAADRDSGLGAREGHLSDPGNWAGRHPEVFEHRRINASLDQPNDDFLSELWEFVARHRAVDSSFVLALEDGSAPRDAVRVFALDLFTLACDLPLVEGLLAAQATWHSPAAVTMLSFGVAIGTGYHGDPPLATAARRFAEAFDVDPDRPDVVVGSERIGSGVEIYLAVATEMADAGLTASAAATIVDEEWPELGGRLKRALGSHYGIADDDLVVFDLFARFEGPRTNGRRALLAELGQGGFQQHVLRRAVQETAVVWRSMWDRWLTDGRTPGTAIGGSDDAVG